MKSYWNKSKAFTPKNIFFFYSENPPQQNTTYLCSEHLLTYLSLNIYLYMLLFALFAIFVNEQHF